MNIDFSKAPEGSTYYTEEDGYWNFCWYKKEKDAWFYKNNNRLADKWRESLEPQSELLLALKEIPTDQPYMPEVGEECEVNHGDDWIKCLYLGVDIYGNYAYQISKGDYKGEFNADPNVENFRPLKTQAEIEREKLIELLAGTLGDIRPLPEVVKAVIDAGWRSTI